MTEFEREVAATIQTVLAQSGWRNYPTAPLAVDLAPRVAAAIAAAHGSQGNKARELLQQAALSALRGETP